VEVIWQVPKEGERRRRLWLRIHASIFDEVMDNLKELSERYKLEMRDLRGEIDGFELMGPMAGRILRRVLKLCKSEIGEKDEVSHSIKTVSISYRSSSLTV